MNEDRNDFSKGSVSGNIISLAVPMVIAQLVQVCYNIVDRVYIGHLPGESTLALTGLGLTFPMITLILAFANLFGTGGAPLCSIARGRRDVARAERIMSNTLTMLSITCIVIMICAYIFMKPILYFFGASDVTYAFAREYMLIYLLGTPFSMIASGMNGFINAQGFGRTGMMTTAIGAVLNVILDPVFIFVFGMGIKGAAAATVISQAVSFAWVMHFLTGKKTILKIRREDLFPDWPLIGEIVTLGISGFVMQATNGFVQVACNATLRDYGGDLYVGIMTVLNSVRDIDVLAVNGITAGAQPVISYNYGAGRMDRVVKCIRFVFITCLSYMIIMWLLVTGFPGFFIKIFNSDPAMLKDGIPAMRLYFLGIFMMAFQFTGQSTFTALGKSRQAVFFSLFRKVIIVIPLTILLPKIPALGVDGVFIAEPVSNFIGGLASFITMVFTVKKMCGKIAAK